MYHFTIISAELCLTQEMIFCLPNYIDASVIVMFWYHPLHSVISGYVDLILKLLMPVMIINPEKRFVKFTKYNYKKEETVDTR